MSVSPKDEQELDDLLEKIHGELDEMTEKMRKKKRTTPTKAFDRKMILKKTKQAFAAMSEEDLSLEDSNETSPIDTQTMRLPPRKSDSVFKKLFGRTASA